MMPTTRRGRYLVRQARYLKRARRAARQRPRGHFSTLTGHKHGAFAAPWVMRGDGSKQLFYPKKTARSFTANPAIPVIGPYTYVVYPHDGHTPPHIRIYYAGIPAAWPPGHRRFAYSGYFRRHVKYRGHKIGRKNGFARWTQRAEWLYNRGNDPPGAGRWPVWDPLHRQPDTTIP